MLKRLNGTNAFEWMEMEQNEQQQLSSFNDGQESHKRIK